MKTSACRDRTPKNQSNKMGTTPQHNTFTPSLHLVPFCQHSHFYPTKWHGNWYWTFTVWNVHTTLIHSDIIPFTSDIPHCTVCRNTNVRFLYPMLRSMFIGCVLILNLRRKFNQSTPLRKTLAFWRADWRSPLVQTYPSPSSVQSTGFVHLQRKGISPKLITNSQTKLVERDGNRIK